MSPRQIFSAVLLIIVIIVILYPTIATGIVRVSTQYEQAIIYIEHPDRPREPLEIKGVTNLEVSFSDVQVHLASEKNTSGWLPISYQTEKLDLTGLTGKSGTIVLTPTIPVGNYDMITMTFSDTYATFNGTTVKVKTDPQSFVVDYPFSVKSGLETELKLKFTADYRALNLSRQVFFEVNPIPD